MATLLLFAFATIGLTNILVHGRILDLLMIKGISIRDWMTTPNFSKELLGCYECTGFWAGMICGSFFSWHLWWMIPIYGFAGSVLAQTYTDLMYLLRSKIEFIVEDDDVGTDN